MHATQALTELYLSEVGYACFLSVLSRDDLRIMKNLYYHQNFW